MNKAQSLILLNSTYYEKYEQACKFLKKNDTEKAKDLFSEIAKSKDPLARKAKMALATIFIRAENYKNAEALLAEEASYFLSAERKKETAAVYIELAEKAVTRESEDNLLADSLNYDKALRLYDYLVEQELPEDLLDDILYQRGKIALTAENYGYAVNAFFEYLKSFDPDYHSQILGVLPGAEASVSRGIHLTKARLGLIKTSLLIANCLPEKDGSISTSSSEIALPVVMILENLISSLKAEVQGKSTSKSEKDEFAQALKEALFYRPFASGLTLEFAADGEGARAPLAAKKAVSYALKFIDRYPNTIRSLELASIVPRTLFKAGFTDEAKVQLNAVIKGEKISLKKEADREKLQMAQSTAHYVLAEIFFKEGNYDEALSLWQHYLTKYPDGSMWALSQNGVHRSTGAIALNSLAEKSFEKCRELLEETAKKRGLSDEQGWLHLAICHTYVVEAKTAGRDEKPRIEKTLYQKALSELTVVGRRYPGEVATYAHLMAADILRYHLDDVEGAVKEYRQSDSSRGRTSLEELTGVELALSAERVFLSSEECFLKVRTRNIEKTSVRIYAINLEDYFRKYHTSKNIDELDLDLVSPDKTFEYDIPGYSKYKEIKLKLPLPLTAVGAYAVTIEGAKFESTVLVIKSDIQVMSAISDKEAIALVKNVKENKVVKNADLTLYTGNNGKVIRYKTDDSGTGLVSLEEAPDESPTLFAKIGSDVAVSSGSIPKRSTNTLRRRGYVYSSRPVYLPGETVHLKAVICSIKNGNYYIEEGAQYRASITTPSGKCIDENLCNLSRFGTLESEFIVPFDSETGTYSIAVTSNDEDYTFNSDFVVEYVKPSKISLVLTPLVAAVMAGDNLTVNATAQFYTGAPLADRKITVSLPTGTSFSLVTDSKGKTEFELDTTPFFRFSEINIRARIDGEGVATAIEVPILAAAIQLKVDMPLSDLRKDQILDIPVTVSLPDKTPLKDHKIEGLLYVAAKPKRPPIPSEIAKKAGLDLSVFEQNEDTKIQTITGTTDEAGQVKLSFNLTVSGEARIAFVVKDSENRELVESRTFTISEKESEELELESTASLEEGDECKIRIHNKGVNGLGLVILSGDSFISREVHSFHKGISAYRFKAEYKHTPNIMITALCDGTEKLNRAQQPITIARKLIISLEMPEEALIPGSSVEALLRACDTKNKPVEGEFSFSMVDKGLLAIRPDLTSNMETFFKEGTERTLDFIAFSSGNYRSRGIKRAISAELINEDKRMDKADEDGRARLKRKELMPPKPRKMAKSMARPCAPPSMKGGGRAMNFGTSGLMALGGCEEIVQECCSCDDEMDMFCSDIGDEAPAKADSAREELTIGAFWEGSIVTNSKGIGHFTIETPKRTSNYKILVRGMTSESLSGEIESSAVVKKDVTVDIKMPDSLIEGDKFKALIYLHNNSSYKGDILLSGTIGEGERKEDFSLTMKVNGPGVTSSLLSEYVVPPCKHLPIMVKAESSNKVFDSIIKTSNVRMWGITKDDCASGKVIDGEKIELSLPDSVKKNSINLEVSLFANHGQELISLLRGGWDLSFDIPSRAGKAIATCIVMEKVRNSNLNSTERRMLQNSARSLIGSLKMCQNTDGSWPIAKSRDNRRIEGNRVATSLSLIAIGLASKLGITNEESSFDSGISWLKSNNSNYESYDGYLSLLALATCGEADFSVLNRLNRMAESLPAEGKALLGLAFSQMDKGTYATSLAQSLIKDSTFSGGNKPIPLTDSSEPAFSDTAKVLTLWLLSETDDFSPLRGKLALEVRQMLSSFFRLHGWMRWAAVAVMASNIHTDDDSLENNFEVTIKSSNETIAIWNCKKNRLFEGLTLYSEDLKDALKGSSHSPLVIHLEFSGKGSCTYSLRLSGTTDLLEKERSLDYSIDTETFYHSPQLYKGRALTESSQIINSVSVEDYAEDYLSFKSFDEGISIDNYVLVTRSIPSGMTVDESTIPSAALAVSTSEGKLHLVFKGKPSSFRLSLMPSCPGTYRVLPTELRELDGKVSSDHLGIERTIEILSTDEITMTANEYTYGWSRNEHLAFGEAYFNDRNYDKAIEHLKTIPSKAYRYYRSAAKALLWIYCEEKFYGPDNIVELFEILEQHHSSVVIPYEKLLVVGRAYHDKGEFEAATMLWRSTLQSAFRDELPVARELEEAGEYLRSISFVEDLYWSYPDEATIVQSYYGLSQDVYRHREQVDSIRETGNEADVETASLTSDDLVEKAARLLQQFLTLHSDLPYADQATFSLLSAYLELRLDENCLTLSSDSIENYPQSEYCDRFKYLKALAAFNLGKFDLALDSAKEVAECESDESDYATFILGQMYQAMGQMENALKAYKKIKDDFSDAELSIHYIERQNLRMDEIVTGSPGHSVSIDLSYCNATKVEVLAYKVDLMRLFLKEKNLDRIANVKLAGITPTCTFERDLAEVPRGTTGKTTIDLPFEKTGAYLVLIRSREAFASGLVLITPLSMEVQETQDAVRATILEGEKKSPVRDVYVKASNGSDFKDDSTDLRGAATIEIDGGDGLTVVARRGKNEYAFFRSKTNTDDVELPWFDVSEKVSYNSSILEENEMLQQQVASDLETNFKRRKKGERGLQANQIRL